MTASRDNAVDDDAVGSEASHGSDMYRQQSALIGRSLVLESC